MGWRWDWFWSILWSAFVHLITLQWSALLRDGDNLKGWWRSLWDEIENRLDGLKGWAEGRISWLKGYAFGLFYRLGMDAARWVGDLRVSLTARINDIITSIYTTRDWLVDLAHRLKNEAIGWAQGAVDQVRAWAEHYTNAARDWLYNAFVWVQNFRDLLSNWLVGARAVIDWLWHHAWGQLQSFLANPLGYVLGWLLDPIRNFINWWSFWGGSLRDFVVQDLPGLRNLLARGLSFLLTFVDRPGETILNLLYPIFLSWVENLIADNW